MRFGGVMDGLRCPIKVDEAQLSTTVDGGRSCRSSSRHSSGW